MSNSVDINVLLNSLIYSKSIIKSLFKLLMQDLLLSQAYLVLFDNGGGNLERDFSSAQSFEMLSA